ncbi:MAG TPA: FAD-dependent oxidoreductase, partial [Spongiibacteraceae bacterium]|nr:FAD-dependent oxidoreductase [Spongiibacteraceae bacterium]
MTQVYQPTSPVAAQSIRQWARETDVLVVGLGAAGASAAIEAATAGAEVEVLELASAGGGTTALAGGQIYLGGGTPIQKACGFEDSAEAMYEYLLMAAGPNADHAKVRAYVDDSLAHYDWLVAHGVEF